MKLLFYCHGCGNGGAERVITILSSTFAKKGYDIRLVTTKRSNNDYECDERVKKVCIFSDGSNAIIRNVKIIHKLRRLVKSYKPDCIISFSAIPNIQAIISTLGIKKRLIISERTDPSRYPETKLGRKLRDVLYPLSNVIVFQTEDALKYFKPSIQKKGIIIYNPISENLPMPYLGDRKRIIVGIGSLGEQKNWMNALKACELFFKDYQDYVFRIYGEGPDKDKLQTYINRSLILKGKVQLMGFSSNAIKDMNSATMYISSSDYEGISNSMLEALATGVPSICTDCPVGGARTFIKSGINGFLVPVNDSTELYKKMRILADDDSLRKQFTTESPKIKQLLSVEKICSEWEKHIIG